MDIITLPILRDNYTYLLHDPPTRTTAVVDPAEAAPVLEQLASLGWELSLVLSTHHHPDHVGGNLEIKRATGCTIVGPAAERARIPGLDVAVSSGDRVEVGGSVAAVFETPGHTSGHITYWFEGGGAVFCGDVLFAMGCGRLFEGSPGEMWRSLQKLAALPGETLVHCGHEYTQSNARFALSVEPGNEDLRDRSARVDAARARGEPTVPFTIAEELRTNPFLRPQSLEIRGALGLGDDPDAASDVEVFAALRSRKDRF